MGRAKEKEEVRKLLDTLPEEASFEDIHYHESRTVGRKAQSRFVADVVFLKLS